MRLTWPNQEASSSRSFIPNKYGRPSAASIIPVAGQFLPGAFIKWFLAALVLSGCYHATVLVPPPGSSMVAGEKYGVSGEEAGVRAVVIGQWQGNPKNLSDLVTPVRVMLENRSGRPLRIRYKEFVLETGDSFKSRALPPFQIQRPGTLAVSPAYPNYGFYLAPPYAPFYPGVAPWSGAFAWEPGYYDDYTTSWEPALPSRDMLQKALPEGVLEDGGTVTGYVYFQRANTVPGTSARVTVELVDAQNEASMGRLSFTFLVAKD